MYQLCAKIRDMSPYTPQTGEYPVRLDANESFIAPPDWLRRKLADAAAAVSFSRYPDPAADGLCAAFAACHGLDPAAVTAGNGSDELISILAACFLQAGDRVVVPAPDFSMYAFYAGLYEKSVVTVEKDERLECTADAVIQAVQESGAAAVLFSNPCNPTGQGLRREEVRRIVTAVDALVVLDEAYMDFWDESLLPEATAYDNLIVLKTCSKALGMAALRLGFAVANPTLTGALRAVKSPYNVGAVTQAIGRAVLEEQAYLRDCNASILRQRDALYTALTALNDRLALGWRVWPTKTNFVLFRTSDSPALHRKLLERGVAVRCLGDCLRVTAPSPEELPVLLAALEDCVKGEADA